MTFKSAGFDGNLIYAAQDLRQFPDFAMNGVGIIEPGALIASAGSGLNSNIAAGRANVRNTVQTQGGLYVVRNDATVSVAHAQGDATNPRVDQLYVKVFDQADGGDASDNILPLVAAGSAAVAGATLDNRTGIATLPANSIPIADVLVHAGDTLASQFTYQDRRPIAGMGITTHAMGTAPAVDAVWPIPLGCVSQVVALAVPGNATSNGGLAVAFYLPRRITVDKLRWVYVQPGTTAWTTSYTWAIYSASGLLVANSTASFTGAIGTTQHRAETLVYANNYTSTLEAGVYFIGFNYATLTGSGTGTWTPIWQLPATQASNSIQAIVPNTIWQTSAIVNGSNRLQNGGNDAYTAGPIAVNLDAIPGFSLTA